MGIYASEFWEDDEDGFWDDVADVIMASYMLGVDGGILSMPANVRQLADFDRITAGVSRFARDYRYKWIKGITDTTRKQTQNAIADWISSGSPLSVLEAMLETVYGEARAKRIAVTEVTRVFSLANTEAWESTGVISQEVVHTAEDDLVCDICNPLDGTHIGIGDIDAKPPFHVNCRCFTTPVVDETLFERKLDDILGL